MYGCESWTKKEAECLRIDAFELWCWRRCLRVPWNARSYRSLPKEISPEYSLEELMLKLKLQSFGHLTEEEMVWWYHQLDGHEFEQASGVGDGQRRLACCSPWGPRVRHDWVTELNWTELKKLVDTQRLNIFEELKANSYQSIKLLLQISKSLSTNPT